MTGPHALSGTRMARWPGGGDVRRFVGELRSPRRVSAVRGLVDGVVVAWTLERQGVRPLLKADGSAAAGSDPARARQVAGAVDAALGLLPMAATCLRRSLTLVRELRRLGLGSALHIGVRTVEGRVEAHAWVQVGDVVVNDDPELVATYSELAAGELERVLPALR